jgi:hypothetical protein
MLHTNRITTVEPYQGTSLLFTFNTGEKKVYDVGSFAAAHPFYRSVIEDETILCSPAIILGGDAIAWDDLHDLSSERIYSDGMSVI